MIITLKKGSGIHIKKTNRGKFTEYCGGKVTSECISRGKNSSDPKIRKRATFAANARRWHHKAGGKLLKAQKGNILNFLKNASIKAAFNENPAVMTASGWTINPTTGEIKLDSFNTPERNLLANNLLIIGEAGLTGPTFGNDIVALYNIIRNPIKSGKTFAKTFKDTKWFITHPKAKKVYHGNILGDIFPLQEARTASSTDVGFHVSSNKNVAKAKDFKNVGLMEAWIPKHNMETLDLGYNNHNLLSNKVIFPFTSPNIKLNSFESKILNKYGNRNIPLRNETWPKITKELIVEAERLVKKGNLARNSSMAKEVNQEVSNFLSKNGKKIIKYNNQVEGGGGISYIITDPSVFYTPQKYNWSLIIDKTKYPLMLLNETSK